MKRLLLIAVLFASCDEWTITEKRIKNGFCEYRYNTLDETHFFDDSCNKYEVGNTIKH